MFIDLHCHTRYSGDNTLEPLDLIDTARRRGLDAVCITEHDSFCASEPVEEIAQAEGFLVFRGVEINTDKGHILAFGLRDDSWKERTGYYTKIASVRPKVEACGGILIPAHPFRIIGAASVSNGLFSMDYINALEVLNGENTERENALAIEAWERLRIPGTAGSDCHFAREVGSCATWFERTVGTLEELISEVKAGRVAPARLDGGEYSRLPMPHRLGECKE
ncbi:MAG: PHP domain-containing protein [Candidatus Abyssobacteria bacterium SURF_17]|uniref:PHP domain-containing protein n=1 Tax=Candidatus Abyssobacteria bacterium SURF_17 TaxID=2093361 RepID=A0A419F073_9BACT|nr:MAG: PHP domain-containing protein [Candidatus Abyssubacteria bacterium SURF_17]